MGDQQQAIAIIPARYGSTRLPGKPLIEIAGKPIVQHVYERARQAKLIDQVFVATDNNTIAQAVTAFGGQAVITSSHHETGTDRIAEAVEKLNLNVELIVNVQGDEPLIDPLTIDAAIEPLIVDKEGHLVMSTTCELLEQAEDLFNVNIVKVVTDKQNNALYFSRSPIPFAREFMTNSQLPTIIEYLQNHAELLASYRKHTGLYVYRREFLLQFTKWPRTPLESAESLEQLRALEYGCRIRVVTVKQHSIGIDTQEDLVRVQRLLEGQSNGQ